MPYPILVPKFFLGTKLGTKLKEPINFQHSYYQ